jgi:hypothetical protein
MDCRLANGGLLVVGRQGIFQSWKIWEIARIGSHHLRNDRCFLRNILRQPNELPPDDRFF